MGYMNSEATAPTTATRAQVIAAPGYPTEQHVEIVTVQGRTLTAATLTAQGVLTETFTLRGNGKWALKGAGQWANYLRFEEER